MIMEQDEIVRRNVAIAEYMGWKLSQGAWFDPDAGFPHSTEMLAFNTDWSILMPVVEKITKESNLGFHFFPPFGREVFTCRFGTNKNYVGGSMIEATWLAVSGYILSKQKEGE